MRIYDRIYEQCKLHNIKGKELGELLGLKKTPMTDWKNNQAKPTVEQIAKMCEIFAVSADYLIFGKEVDLTPTEQQLLDAYRIADARGKRTIMKIALDEADQGKSFECQTGKEAI